MLQGGKSKKICCGVWNLKFSCCREKFQNFLEPGEPGRTTVLPRSRNQDQNTQTDTEEGEHHSPVEPEAHPDQEPRVLAGWCDQEPGLPGGPAVQPGNSNQEQEVQPDTEEGELHHLWNLKSILIRNLEYWLKKWSGTLSTWCSIKTTWITTKGGPRCSRTCSSTRERYPGAGGPTEDGEQLQPVQPVEAGGRGEEPAGAGDPVNLGRRRRGMSFKLRRLVLTFEICLLQGSK